MENLLQKQEKELEELESELQKAEQDLKEPISPSAEDVEKLLKRLEVVLELNDTLKTSLSLATKGILALSDTTSEQLNVVLEFTSAFAKDIDLGNGVIIPNAKKLIESAESQMQGILDSIPNDYAELKAKLSAEFDKFIAENTHFINDFKITFVEELREINSNLENNYNDKAKGVDNLIKNTNTQLSEIREQINAKINELNELDIPKELKKIKDEVAEEFEKLKQENDEAREQAQESINTTLSEAQENINAKLSETEEKVNAKLSEAEQKLESFKGFDYIEATPPTNNLNPTKDNALYLDTLSGILWICRDRSEDANVWEEFLKTDSGFYKIAKENPSKKENPENTINVYLNAISFELFYCLDTTIDNNVWFGSKGSAINCGFDYIQTYLPQEAEENEILYNPKRGAFGVFKDGEWITINEKLSLLTEDPEPTYNPAFANALIVNTTSGELFLCTNNTTNENEFINLGKRFHYSEQGKPKEKPTKSGEIYLNTINKVMFVSSLELEWVKLGTLNGIDIAGDGDGGEFDGEFGVAPAIPEGDGIFINRNEYNNPLPGEKGFGAGIAPSRLVTTYGLEPMPGCHDRESPNFGNYYDSTGSVMVFIPFMYRTYTHDTRHPYGGMAVNLSYENFRGAVIPRCFINGGKPQRGFFIDKYHISLENGRAVSKRGKEVLSSDVFTQITQTSFGAVTNGMGGGFAVVKSRGGMYCLPTCFMYSHIADIADAHFQACYEKTNGFEDGDYSLCLWADKEPYQPKGNTNYLKDIHDDSLSFSGGTTYSTYRALTGGVKDEELFGKITHNGQKNGIADIAGNVVEICHGYTFRSDQHIKHYILKPEVDINGMSLATHSELANYKRLEHLPRGYAEGVGGRYNGNSHTYAVSGGVNKEMIFTNSSDINSEEYCWDAIGIPRKNQGQTGDMRYGGDNIYYINYCENKSMVFRGAHYGNNAGNGLRYAYLYNSYAYAHLGNSLRACLIPAYIDS